MESSGGRADAGFSMSLTLQQYEWRWSSHTLIVFWYCLHQECKRLPEAGCSKCSTLVMPHAHDDEVVRRNNQRGLPTRASHIIGFLRYRKRAVTVDPEET